MNKLKDRRLFFSIQKNIIPDAIINFFDKVEETLDIGCW
jgi:hypothetical protein